MSEIKEARILKEKRFPMKKIIGGAVALIAIIIVASTSFRVVPAGHSGVVVTLGKVSSSVLSEG
ncbi:MAG: hypothetical protein LBS36_09080, partial [Oscillospiraceae bacterium]|nr:hypothetical protein [Oscillospiraceae bacterium]